MSLSSSDAAYKIRTMIVDDSVIIRMLITRILKEEDNIEIVSAASNGREAIDQARTAKPDVILLDLEMPVMDGIAAIPALIHDNPKSQIILCSAHSEKGADITLKGLSLGACDFILKPSALTGPANRDQFKAELVQKIGGISALRKTVRAAPEKKEAITDFELRPSSHAIHRPSIIAIGSSTGGPNALTQLLKAMPRLSVPIVITQHMPKTFTKILADQLTKSGNTPCLEGEEGMEVRAGYAYIAPGDKHMVFTQDRNGIFIHLDSGPPENFCRPAVDPMIRSLVDLYGGRILGIILTGMGADGLEGCRALVKAGGHVIAQDEASSAVWGMPGAVAKAGLCTKVGNIAALANQVEIYTGLQQ